MAAGREDTRNNELSILIVFRFGFHPDRVLLLSSIRVIRVIRGPPLLFFEAKRATMERFLDLIFGIRWWQWLLGTATVAGLYYLVATYVVPFFRGVKAQQAAEAARLEQEEAERQREQEKQEREAARREYLKQIPSGPVEPTGLPKALLRARNRVVAVPNDAELTFGTRRGASVQIMSRGVSREHAKIRPEPRGYVLYDLMSQAGTFVGGKRVESQVLADGDAIRLGTVEMTFHFGEPPAKA